MASAQPSYRIGVVGVPGGWSSERLADTVARHTGVRLLIDLAHVVADLGRGSVRFGDEELTGLDALIVKKLGPRYDPDLLDRLEVLHYLEQRGVGVFSRPLAITRLLNRLAGTVSLALAKIPMPDTVVTEGLEEAEQAVRSFGRAVLKPLFTSKGRGMRVVGDTPDLPEQLRAFREAGNHMLYVQRMVELPGRDLGVSFLGGEFLGCYARENRDGAWSTTTRAGGRYAPAEPSDEIVALARRAQAPFGLDFTCVDVAETAEGPVVFEVSAFGGFRGLLEAAGVDAAERYVQFVIERLRDGRERR